MSPADLIQVNELVVDPARVDELVDASQIDGEIDGELVDASEIDGELIDVNQIDELAWLVSTIWPSTCRTSMGSCLANMGSRCGPQLTRHTADLTPCRPPLPSPSCPTPRRRRAPIVVGAASLSGWLVMWWSKWLGLAQAGVEVAVRC